MYHAYIETNKTVHNHFQKCITDAIHNCNQPLTTYSSRKVTALFTIFYWFHQYPLLQFLASYNKLIFITSTVENLNNKEHIQNPCLNWVPTSK